MTLVSQTKLPSLGHLPQANATPHTDDVASLLTEILDLLHATDLILTSAEDTAPVHSLIKATQRAAYGLEDFIKGVA